MRGLWSRRRPSPELAELIHGEPPLGRRHVGLLALVASSPGQPVGELAAALGLSLPAASKVATDLETHGLVSRREDPEDRRRTVVELAPATSGAVTQWLTRRDHPLERALATLTAEERAAFLKGLRALGDALMEESPRGSLRPHHRAPHRRRSHRDRPV